MYSIVRNVCIPKSLWKTKTDLNFHADLNRIYDYCLLLSGYIFLYPVFQVSNMLFINALFIFTFNLQKFASFRKDYI